MNILLGVTGSIASYKAYDLVRKLIKNGHDVKVILTAGALKFIKAETFNYLGVQDVFLPDDDFRPRASSILHIDLMRWAQKIVLAPTSANTLSRLACGITNDLLTSTLLANSSKPVLIFPAMNTKMWKNPRIQDHLEKISNHPLYAVIKPIKGKLACGENGLGKLPSLNSIAHLIDCFNPILSPKQKILITAGATSSPLDPVRFLTNPSTGKMGFEIAKAFLAQGHKVHLIAGHQAYHGFSHLLHHPHFKLSQAPTTFEMRDKVLNLFPDCQLYISSAAIADIIFDASSDKLKKESLQSALPITKSPDILKEVLLQKKDQKIIGFAAETDISTNVFIHKMMQKPVDLLIGNRVSNDLSGLKKNIGFKVSEGEYYFLSHQHQSSEHSVHFEGPQYLTKSQVASHIVRWYQDICS